ncbi:MAG: TolC family protein, partial [Phycisphaerae bacterium]
MNLPDALAYAMRHGRDLLDAKEELYLSALDLTLERHLWTPQFVASVRTDFTNFPDDEALRRALNTAGELSVTQRLPYGGDVTARVLHRLMRDVTDRVEKGESGQVILEAQLPLLRGAGSVAYESRYQAERNLIYAVRDYERFRRTYLVGIAADYFNLQQLRANIDNTYKSYIDRADDLEKAEFIQQMGRSRNVRDAPRARSNLRSAEADLVSAKERYATTLDRFKVRIGMPVVALLDVIDQDEDKWSRTVDDLLPDVSVKLAVDVAVRQRLDLLNSADRLDDRRRGVVIAKNRVLPDLDLSGSLTMDSNPDQLRATSLRTERATWQGGIEFRLDDRRTERNAYRASLISLRRAKRDYEESTDLVRADVRQALRRVFQQQNLRQIQAFNVKENNDRLLGARAQFNLGKADNQDVIDAANELLRAENDLARALASYRVSILEFRRDTGTLRITDDGRWAMGPEDANPAGIDRGAGDNAG